MATYIILGVLALIVGAVIYGMIKNKRETGKAIGCSGCPGSSGCAACSYRQPSDKDTGGPLHK